MNFDKQLKNRKYYVRINRIYTINIRFILRSYHQYTIKELDIPLTLKQLLRLLYHNINIIVHTIYVEAVV